MQPLRLFHGIDGDNVRVIEGGDRSGLALEPLQTARLRGQLRWKYLERNASAETLVLSGVDLSHPSLPESPEHPVVSERAAE